MKTLLLIFALPSLTTLLLHGGEPAAPTTRQKLHARILTSVPAPAPKPAPEQPDAETPATSPVVMKPVQVTESKLMERVTAAIARQEQDRRDEQFSPLSGGTIAQIGPMKLGGWFSPAEGWTFLRLNKAQTPRQVEAAASRMKELQELAKMPRAP